jgi:aspartyl-tRNA synthetase
VLTWDGDLLSWVVDMGGVPDQGDLLLLAAGVPALVHKALDRVRQFVAAELGEVDKSMHALLWVTGAPCLLCNTVHDKCSFPPGVQSPA